MPDDGGVSEITLPDGPYQRRKDDLRFYIPVSCLIETRSLLLENCDDEEA